MEGTVLGERGKERREKGHLCSILSRSSFSRTFSPSFLLKNKFMATWVCVTRVFLLCWGG